MRQTKTGKLRINKAKIKADEHLDGKFLLSTSDDTLATDDVVLGYKQLMDVERCFRDLKHTLDIRPVYHRLSERIQAHVLICWLGLLFIRVAEQETEKTWHTMTQILSTIHAGQHEYRGDHVVTTNPLTPAQAHLFKKLNLPLPPKIYDISMKK